MTGMWSIVVCDLGIGKCCRLLCKGFRLMVYFERVERNYGSTKRIADLQHDETSTLLQPNGQFT